MPLGRLRISAVRCLAEVDIELGQQDCYFYGPNGAGKSSLLESVHLLARGRSFRTRDTRKLVRHGADRLAVYGEIWTKGGVHRAGVGFGAGDLEKRLDAAPLQSMAELARLLPVHVVDPSSHALVEGGPSERRRFLDWGVFHVERSYLDAWRKYRRALGQRNAALKIGASERELAIWTAGLADVGEKVHAMRVDYAAQLGRSAALLGAELLGLPLTVEYRRGWPQGVGLGETLLAGTEQDRAAAHTRAGPHRADLLLGSPAGGLIRDEASRGQQKLAAAALVLAQVQTLAALGLGERPVLLVDDPAAELDTGALDRLRRVVERTEAQLLITGLSEVLLPPRAGARVFHVEQGRLRAVL